MALNIKLLSFGDTIKFARNGATIVAGTPSGTTVSKTVKPSGATPADWLDFCTVEEGTITGVFSDEDVMSPSPGVYRRTEKFRSMLAHDINIIGQECNEIVLESVLGTAALTTSKVDIATGNGQVRGWLQITRAAQNDATVLLLEVYGVLSVKTLKADGKRFKPEIEFAVLHNSMNEVTPSLDDAG
jgi:hypothetical protein